MISALFWTLLIALGSLWPGVGTPPVAQLDKLEHAAAYLVLALLYLRVFRRAATALGLAFLVGLSIELLQAAVPGRFCSAWDLAANSAGLALGAWIRSRPRLRRGLSWIGAGFRPKGGDGRRREAD